MEKVRYMISDAANLVNVETHVLRYWEDELELAIPRNEMGHRYYTKENIKEFQRIKELKDKGYQLKAIRMLIHNGNIEQFTPVEQPLPMDKQPIAPSNLKMEQVLAQPIQELSAEDRMAQFRELMSDIVGHAIASNNEELCQTLGQEMEERVLKEMDYLMREQEDAQEARFRKLDAAIRGSVKKKHTFFHAKEQKEETKSEHKKRLPQ